MSVRVLLGFQRHRARRYSIRAGRSGSVTVIQRFGGGLNLNVHFHTLLLDGVQAEDIHTVAASLIAMLRREKTAARPSRSARRTRARSRHPLADRIAHAARLLRGAAARPLRADAI